MSKKKRISKTQKILSLIFLGLWGIPVLWVLIFGGRLWWERYQLSQFGEVTQGVIVGNDVLHFRNVRYYVIYEFSPAVETEKITLKKEVAPAVYANSPVGTFVFVRYLPSNPQVSNLEGNDLLRIQGLGLIMKLSAVMLLLGLVGVGVISFKRVGWL